jgi:uncharacterized protein GlcG (DUF336 family)
MQNRAAWLVSTVIAVTVLAPYPAETQVLTERNVSLGMARTIADAAIAACKAGGFDISVVVVDRSGAVRLMMRSDSASPHNAELARRKAYTARTYKSPSTAFRDWSAGTSDLAGQRLIADVIPLGGGVPIMIGTDAIGGVGVSGTPMQDSDEKCAVAGRAAVSGQLK